MVDEDLIQKYKQAIQDVIAADRPPEQKRVYILGCGDHIKVGIANNVQSRILELQIGNPARIVKLWETVPMTRLEATRLERRVHQELADTRISGEWFECSADLAMSTILRLSGE